MPSQGRYISSLNRQCRCHFILQGKVAAHRIWSDVIELDSTKIQTICVYRGRIKRKTRQSGFQCGVAATWVIDRSKRIFGVNVASIRRVPDLIMELELEGIVFSQVGEITTVFKTVVEKSKPASSHKLRTDLICEAYARGEV